MANTVNAALKPLETLSRIVNQPSGLFGTKGSSSKSKGEGAGGAREAGAAPPDGGIDPPPPRISPVSPPYHLCPLSLLCPSVSLNPPQVSCAYPRKSLVSPRPESLVSPSLTWAPRISPIPSISHVVPPNIFPVSPHISCASPIFPVPPLHLLCRPSAISHHFNPLCPCIAPLYPLSLPCDHPLLMPNPGGTCLSP